MSLQLIGTNQTNSTLLAYDGSAQQINFFSAFGSTSVSQNGQLPGFNGQRPDPFTGASHLGNGYRAYNPVLMRFTCPDNQSPFGVGGINPYAYCENDPVNFTDPSGHGILTWAIEGMTFLFSKFLKNKTAEFVAKVLAKTAKYTLKYGTQFSSRITHLASYLVENNNPQAAAKLDKATQSLGYIHSITSLYSNFNNIFKNVKKLVSRSGTLNVEATLSESSTPIDERGESISLEGSEIGESSADELTSRSTRSTQRALSVANESESAVSAFQDKGIMTSILNVPAYQITTSTVAITSSVLGFAGDMEAKRGNTNVAVPLQLVSKAYGVAHTILSVPKYIMTVKSAVQYGKRKIADLKTKKESIFYIDSVVEIEVSESTDL